MSAHITSVSSPDYPTIVVSITKIKSKVQTLCPRSLSKHQKGDSNLDIADNKTWTLEHDTVIFLRDVPGPHILSSLQMLLRSPGPRPSTYSKNVAWDSQTPAVVLSKSTAGAGKAAQASCCW